MTLIQMIILAIIQGTAELLPVSSSAHVIVAEKLMGLDPSSPHMTFLLVMLHTGTMFAVLIYFWPRWKKLNREFFKMTILATAVTGVVGLTLKKLIEKVILEIWLGETNAEIEMLFKSLPLIAFSLASVGLLILWGSNQENKAKGSEINQKSALTIGFVQGLCLPFRGFSRSGATISTAMSCGVSRALAEDFSFALAVILTPPVIVRELYRLYKSAGEGAADFNTLLLPSLMSMGFSFLAGRLALRWLSSWLENGKWKYFGIYCLTASLGVCLLHFFVLK